MECVVQEGTFLPTVGRLAASHTAASSMFTEKASRMSPVLLQKPFFVGSFLQVCEVCVSPSLKRNSGQHSQFLILFLQFSVLLLLPYVEPFTQFALSFSPVFPRNPLHSYNGCACQEVDALPL